MKVQKVNVGNLNVLAQLAFLHSSCLPTDEYPDFSHGDWWIAYDEQNNPVAFAGLYASVQWAQTGYLCRAGVLESARGKGIQKLLIKARIRQAKKLGYLWLVSDTRRNPASSNALIACGFRLYEPRFPWGFKNSIYFRLKL